MGDKHKCFCNLKTFIEPFQNKKEAFIASTYFVVYLQNLTKKDIQRAKNASILYFKYPMPDDQATCLVDRFIDYPL